MCRNVLVLVAIFILREVTCGASDDVETLVGKSDVSGCDGATRWLFGEISGEDVSRPSGTQIEESRKRKTKDQAQPGFMEKILPMMVTPFLISSSMIPMMLISIFFMLVKSAFIGKIGIILLLINMLRNRSNSGGFFTHNVDVDSRQGEKDLAMDHYGYHGDEEYGAYVNRRRRRRRKK